MYLKIALVSELDRFRPMAIKPGFFYLSVLYLPVISPVSSVGPSCSSIISQAPD